MIEDNISIINEECGDVIGEHWLVKDDFGYWSPHNPSDLERALYHRVIGLRTSLRKISSLHDVDWLRCMRCRNSNPVKIDAKEMVCRTCGTKHIKNTHGNYELENN